MEVVAGRYEILRQVGRGGQARTFLAVDRVGGGQVAVKELALDRVETWKSVELFEREAQTLRHLDHPGIPRYVDAFHVGGTQEDPVTRFFLVQEFVSGETVATAIGGGRRWTEAEIVAFMRQVLTVLEYLHGLNPQVVHRDIKPSNIMYRPDGRAVLIDFGALQAVLPTTSEVGSTFVGTSGYMAPEQPGGRATPATDIYALGATIVHMLGHHHPVDLRVKRLRLQYRHVVRCSPALLAVLDRMLEPAVEDRFGSASDVLLALDDLHRAAAPRRPGGATRRRGVRLGLIIWLLAGVGIGGGYLLARRLAGDAGPRGDAAPGAASPGESLRPLREPAEPASAPASRSLELPVEYAAESSTVATRLAARSSRLVFPEWGEPHYALRATLRNDSGVERNLLAGIAESALVPGETWTACLASFLDAGTLVADYDLTVVEIEGRGGGGTPPADQPM